MEFHGSAARGDLRLLAWKRDESNHGDRRVRGNLEANLESPSVSLEQRRLTGRSINSPLPTSSLRRQYGPATAKAAQNEIFNITNGDTFRWQHMWPKIAKMLDMDFADPTPFTLTTYMEDKEPAWEAIVAKYGLQPIPYRQIVSWGFGDMIFNSGFDNVSNTVKARLAGFHDCIDTETMFHSFFQSLREKSIIPR